MTIYCKFLATFAFLLAMLLGPVRATPAPIEISDGPFSMPPVGSSWSYNLHNKKINVLLVKKVKRASHVISYLSDVTRDPPLLWEVVTEHETGIYTSLDSDINVDHPPLDTMECLIKPRLALHDKWERSLGIFIGQTQTKVFMGYDDVATQSGSMKAAKVQEVSVPFSGGGIGIRHYITYWYAPKIVLVKMVKRVRQLSYVLELSSFKPGAP